MQLSLRTPSTSRASRRAPDRSRLFRPVRDRTQPDQPQAQAAPGAEHLFATARDALVMIDLASDRIVRWNPAAEHLFGYSEAQAVGMNVQMPMPPDVARLHRERVAHYLRSGEREMLVGRPPSNVPALSRGGVELRVELSVVPLDPPGAPRRWALLAFRDAACQHQAKLQAVSPACAEPARGDLQGQLRDSQQVLDQTASDLAAHAARIRRAAQRLARLACSGGADQTRRVALLAHVVEARTRDLQLKLEQIDTAASIARGAFELRPARVNLVPLINGLVAEARVESPMHRFKFSAPQGLTVTCDADRVVSVLGDLLRRAVRRYPHGCWIDVDLHRPLAGVAYLEVRDYGRPLSPREREQQGSASPDRGWLLDRQIIDQHGGTLTLELPPEGGTRVRLSLPTRGGRLVAKLRSSRSSRSARSSAADRDTAPPAQAGRW
jgi:PAS domain S-box-containing protein